MSDTYEELAAALSLATMKSQALELERARYQALYEEAIAPPPPEPEPEPEPDPVPPSPPPSSGSPLADATLVLDQDPGETIQQAMRRLWQAAPNPDPGDILAIRLRGRTSPTLGIAAGSVHSPDYVPGWFGGATVRLVGDPSDYSRCRIDPQRAITGGDTVALHNSNGEGLNRGRLEFYHLTIAAAGRSALLCNTGNPVELGFYRMNFVESPEAVTQALQDGGSWFKWCMQLYRCGVTMKDVSISCPTIKEHGAYWHGTGGLDNVLEDVTVRGLGGQVFQFTERESEGVGSPASNVTIRRLDARGFHRDMSRASMALTFAGSGLRALVEDSTIIGGVDGGMPKGIVTTWSPTSDDQHYADEDLTQGGYGNVSLTLRRNTLEVRGDADREWCNLTDCGTITVEDNVITSSRRADVGKGYRGVGRLIWRGNTTNNPAMQVRIEGHGDGNVTNSYDLQNVGATP